MKKNFTYKGRFVPVNPKKYKGDVSNIIYRSLWEKRFMKYCDTNNSILAWASEELIIPYLSPIDNKVHRYYPDFVVKVKSIDNKIKIMVIEVKPKRETAPPKSTGKKKLRYMTELKTWGVNSAKWKAAEKYCKERNWEFKILTEDQLLP